MGSCVCQEPRARQAAHHPCGAENRQSLAGRWLQTSLRALQMPRLSDPTCITCLQSGHPDWPAWETPLGNASHLGGSHHELSAVLGTSPSPTPLSHVLSALPEPCFKRDQLEATGKPTRSFLPPCKVELAQEAATRS